jgi:hypothetical protein
MGDSLVNDGPRHHIPISIALLWGSGKQSSMMTFPDDNDSDSNGLASSDFLGSFTDRCQLDTNDVGILALCNAVPEVNDAPGNNVRLTAILGDQICRHTFNIGNRFCPMPLIARHGGVATSKGIDTARHAGETRAVGRCTSRWMGNIGAQEDLLSD